MRRCCHVYLFICTQRSCRTYVQCLIGLCVYSLRSWLVTGISGRGWSARCDWFWQTDADRYSTYTTLTSITAAHAHAPDCWIIDISTVQYEARPIYVDSRVTQGLEAPPRTSTSHLATDPGSRPSAAQSRSELSLATRSGPRTMEATRGNGYAPVRGMRPAMMTVRGVLNK